MRISDWSSDVGSSDLVAPDAVRPPFDAHLPYHHQQCRLAGRIEAERRGWLRRRHGGGGYESALACFQMGMGGLADKPCRTRVDRKYLVELCKAKINQRSAHDDARSEEHTSELQSLMRISYAVFCLKKKIKQ